MKRFARRPSPGTVMGTVAVFVALGGVAGALPGKDTVDNDDVEDLKYKSIGLKNGWGGASGSYEPGAAIDAQGIVHLRGAVAQGIADGNNFGRLPQAVRPDETVSFPIDVAGPAPTNGGELVIGADGEMTVSGNATQHKLFSSLDGISFEAGN